MQKQRKKWQLQVDSCIKDRRVQRALPFATGQWLKTQTSQVWDRCICAARLTKRYSMHVEVWEFKLLQGVQVVQSMNSSFWKPWPHKASKHAATTHAGFLFSYSHPQYMSNQIVYSNCSMRPFVNTSFLLQATLNVLATLVTPYRAFFWLWEQWELEGVACQESEAFMLHGRHRRSSVDMYRGIARQHLQNNCGFIDVMENYQAQQTWTRGRTSDWCSRD